MSPRSFRLALAIVLAAFVGLHLFRGLRDPVVHLHDFFGHRSAAGSLMSGDLSGALSPWFPLGYPLALGLAGTLAGGDLLLAARLLSALASAAALGASAWIVLNVSGRAALALVVAVFTGLAPPWLEWAAAEGSDLPSTALLLLAIGLLTGAKPRPLAAGMLGGLSYLFRYSSLVPCLAAALWLVACGGGSWRSRGRWVPAGRFTIGFLLGAAPQIAAALWVKGTPVYSYMAKNVWFGIYGEGDWQTRWDQVPDTIGLLETIGIDPARFLVHWGQMLGAILLTALALPEKMLGHGLNWLLPFGLLHAAFRRRGPAGLWGVMTVGYTAALAMAFIAPRYFLPLLPWLVFVTCWFLWDTLPDRSLFRGRAVPVRALVLVSIFAWRLGADLPPALDLPAASRRVMAVYEALARAGCTSPGQVLSTSGDYQDLSTHAELGRWNPDRFEPVRDLPELAAGMRRRGYRYLIYDRFYGVDRVAPAFEYLLDPARDRHGPLQRLLRLEGTPEVAVYELREARE